MKGLKKFKLDLGGYKPKPGDEQEFVANHEVEKTPDANGNGDDVFNAANVKTVERAPENHGYKSQEDEKVYEGQSFWGAQLLEMKSFKELCERSSTQADRFDEAASPEEIKRQLAQDREDRKTYSKAGFKSHEMQHELGHETPQANKQQSLYTRSGYRRATPTTTRPAGNKPATRYYHKVDFADRGLAKAEGMKWDSDKKKWYHTDARKSINSAFKHDIFKYDNINEDVESIDEKKKVVKGKGVGTSGAYDSVPLGITVANESLAESVELDDILLSLDEETKFNILQMLSSDGTDV